MTRPAATHALVVGIEQYATPDWPVLDGPASDAVKFVDWLDTLGVPPANIHLFLSPLKENVGIRPKARVEIRPATANNVFDAITNDLARLDDADVLFVFWGGHGVADKNGERYLVYGDSTPQTTWNLNVGSLITALQTERYAGIDRQILIFDACANYIEHLGITDLPVRSIVHGNPRTPEHQFVLFATQPGQVAKNITAERTGALSREVLSALKGEPLPPDMVEVTRRVKDAFFSLRRQGLVRQVPLSMEVTFEGGDRRRFVRGRQIDPTEVSSFTSRLYDRSDQDASFSERFIERYDQRCGVHAYLIFGEQMEAHRSFMVRLVKTWVDDASTSLHGTEDGSVGLVESVDITDHAIGLEALKQSIRKELIKAAEVVKRVESGWQLIGESRRLRAYRTLAVAHLIRVERWEPAFTEFLSWYIDDFWNLSQKPEGSPDVLLFLAVELAENTRAVSVTDRLLRRKSTRDRTIQQLELVQRSAKAPTLCLAELTPLKLNDVADWFVYFVKDVARLDEFECRKHAEEVLSNAKRRRDEIPRTDHIENLLGSKYQELAQVRIE